MENQSTSTHPMILVAAASVTLLSLTGVAVLLGWLPSPMAPQAASAPMPAVIAMPAEKSATLNIPAGSRVTVSTVSEAPASQASKRVTTRPTPAVADQGQQSTARSTARSTASSRSYHASRDTRPVANDLHPENTLYVNHSRPAVGVCRDCGTVVDVREMTRRGRVSPQYQVTVRLNDGSMRTVNESQVPLWRSGDRVRIGNGQFSGI